jgi:hypothetical protein
VQVSSSFLQRQQSQDNGLEGLHLLVNWAILVPSPVFAWNNSCTRLHLWWHLWWVVVTPCACTYGAFQQMKSPLRELGLVWEAVYHSKPVLSNRQFGRGAARSMGVADEAENPEGTQQVRNEDLIHLLWWLLLKKYQCHCSKSSQRKLLFFILFSYDLKHEWLLDAFWFFVELRAVAVFG